MTNTEDRQESKNWKIVGVIMMGYIALCLVAVVSITSDANKRQAAYDRNVVIYHQQAKAMSRYIWTITDYEEIAPVDPRYDYQYRIVLNSIYKEPIVIRFWRNDAIWGSLQNGHIGDKVKLSFIPKPKWYDMFAPIPFTTGPVDLLQGKLIPKNSALNGQMIIWPFSFIKR